MHSIDESWSDLPNEGASGRRVPMVNWNDVPSPVRERADRIAERVRSEVHPWGEAISWPGSYSFTLNGKTVVKLAGQKRPNSSLLVGFSSAMEDARGFAEQLGTPMPCRYGPDPEPFSMVALDASVSDDAVVAIIVDFLKRAYESI